MPFSATGSTNYSYLRMLILVWLSMFLVAAASNVLAQSSKQFEPFDQPVTLEVTGPAVRNGRMHAMLLKDRMKAGGSIRVIDLQTGQTIKEIPYDAPAKEIVAVAPDASSVVLKSAKDNHIIWRLEEPTGLVEFAEPKGKGGVFEYLSADRLFAHTISDKFITIWSALDGTCLNPIKKQKIKHQTKKWEVVPAANVVYSWASSSRFRRYPLESEFVPEPLSLVGKGKITGQTVSPDGTKVVGTLTEKGLPSISHLAIWDGESGKLICKNPFPGTRTGEYHWLNDDMVIEKTGKFLYSVSQQKFIARAQFQSSRPQSAAFSNSMSKTADGSVRVFPELIEGTSCVLFTTRFGNKTVMTVRDVLSPEFTKRLSELPAESQYLLPKGSSIAVDVQFDGTSPLPGFKKGVAINLENLIRDAGFVVMETAENKLTIDIEEIETGRKGSFSGRDGGGYSVDVKEIHGALRLTNKDGVSLVDRKINGGPQKSVSVKAGQNFFEEVDKTHWSRFLKAIDQLNLQPEYQTLQLETVLVDHGMKSSWFDAANSTRERIAKKTTDREKYDRFKNSNNSNYREMPDVNDSSSQPWSVKAFALPELDQRILRKSMDVYPLDEKWTVRGFKLATIKTAQVVVHAIDAEGNWYVDRYDLKTRKRLSRTPVERDSKLLDFRPDGKYWMIIDPANRYLQIYESVDRRASPDESKAEIDLGILPCTMAQFSGKDMFLTTQTGVVEWDEESKSYSFTKATTRGKYGPDSPVSVVARRFGSADPVFARPFRSTLGLSPGRKYFADVDGGKIGLFNCQNGKLAGYLKHSAVTSNRNSVIKPVFRPDGKQIAVSSNGSTNIWNLETSERLRVIPRALRISAWNDDFVSRMDWLISLTTDTEIWRHNNAGGVQPVWQPYRDAWSMPNGTKAIVLNRRSIVNSTLSKAMPKFLTNIQIPQDRLTIELEKDNTGNAGSGGLGSDPFNQQTNRTDVEKLKSSLLETVRKRFEAEGKEVTADADVKLIVRVTDFEREFGFSSRNNNQLTMLFENGDDTAACFDSQISLTYRVESSQGNIKNLASDSLKWSAVDYQIDWSAEDPIADLRRQVHRQAVDIFANMPLPEFWIADRDPSENVTPRQHQIGETTLVKNKEKHVILDSAKQLMRKRRK